MERRASLGAEGGSPTLAARSVHTLEFPDGGALVLGQRTLVMGVLNVTPDSFFDGGRYATLPAAVEQAERMVEEGAAIIDVGGESTRPGALAVGAAEEADRVLPVVEALRALGSVRISIDTRKAGVARQALEAGADMVNDVSALGDPEMGPLLAATGAPVVLMHMRGTPETMQRDTDYGDVVGEVADFLRARIDCAHTAGVADAKIVVDPGIGFGKSAAGNLVILKRLSQLRILERPVLIGVSRKSFIGRALDLPVEDRLAPSLAVAAFASAMGAHVIRAHDVAATVRAVHIIDAVREA